MRELIVSEFVSLDGVMQAPGTPEEDPTGGFTHGGWTAGYWDGEMGEFMGEWMKPPLELLLGRKTYEIFAAHWPYADDPAAEMLNGAIKHVASRTLTNLEWHGSRLIEGDTADGIRTLKSQDGPDLNVNGSSDLLQTLLGGGLVDELRLLTFPVVLGSGKRLFGEGARPEGLELTELRQSSTGVVMSVYRTGQDIKKGSFGLEEPSEAELERRSRLD